MSEIIKFHSGKKQKIILKCFLSPGDIVMLTAAIRDLKIEHGDRFLIDVRTSADQIWENNPHLTKLDENDEDVQIIEPEYPIIHRSNTAPFHFIHGYRMFLEDTLGVKIPATDFKGDIHISDLEKSWVSQIEELGFKEDFWIVNCGGKTDFTAKWLDPSKIQKVIDYFNGKIKFVQVGELGLNHFHPKLNNVIDLRGKTDIRQLIRLVYHSVGTLSPVSLLMHLSAAVETKHGRPLNRAGVVWAGGREPSQWEAYPHHQFIHTNGALPCCDNGGCWKSRCSLIGDGDEKDIKDTCVFPVKTNRFYNINIEDTDKNVRKSNIEYFEPKCLNLISHKRIIESIELYYKGGSLK